MELEAVLLFWGVFGGWIGISMAAEFWSQLNILGKAVAVILALPAAVVAAVFGTVLVSIITAIQLLFIKNSDYLAMQIWRDIRDKDSKTTEGDAESE